LFDPTNQNCNCLGSWLPRGWHGEYEQHRPIWCFLKTIKILFPELAVVASTDTEGFAVMVKYESYQLFPVASDRAHPKAGKVRIAAAPPEPVSFNRTCGLPVATWHPSLISPSEDG
jgi:hypothetical protein